jgi:hypothetical protein
MEHKLTVNQLGGKYLLGTSMIESHISTLINILHLENSKVEDKVLIVKKLDEVKPILNLIWKELEDTLSEISRETKNVLFLNFLNKDNKIK